MTRIVFITPETPPCGFSAAGFEQLLTDSRSALGTMQQAVTEVDVGVVIVDERLLEGIDDQTLHQLQQGWRGIFLVLPTPTGALPVEEDYLQRLIRRALGYHVRIRE